MTQLKTMAWCCQARPNEVEGLMLSTWQYQFPGKSWSWSRSAGEVVWQTSAEQECCQTGSGWHDESQSHRRTLCPPGKHTHTRFSYKHYSTLHLFFLVLLFSASPPRHSAEDVVGSGGVNMTQCSLYRRQKTSAAMEDVTYNHWAPQWEEFPVFPSGKLHKLQARSM